MNRLVRVVLLSLAAGACLLTSCKEDDWEGKRENPNPEVCKVPDSYTLRSSFLELDQDGNVVDCYFGKYDPATPGVVSITVKNYARALEVIKMIVPDEAEVTETEDQLIWNLKDVDGKSEGQMVFKRSTAPGQFAVVEIPQCSRPLTQVVFKKPLLTDSWMDEYNTCDALDNFYLGAPIDVSLGKLPEGATSNFGHGQGMFLVIREYEAGVHDGLLLRLNNTENNYVTIKWEFNNRLQEQIDRAMKYAEALLVKKILHDNTSFVTTMTSMGMASWDNGFMFDAMNAGKDVFFASTEVRINFKTGETNALAMVNAWYYREAWLYKFYVEPAKEDGALKVIIDSRTSGVK